MKLREFTTYTTEDGSRIVRAAGRVSTHDDPEKQTESITFQLEIDESTNLNGAILRAKVLQKVHETLFQLGRDYERLGDKFRS